MLGDSENKEPVSPEASAFIEKAMETLVGDGKIVIGHFGGLEIDGRPQQWWSIRYGNAVNRLLTNPDYKVAQILSVLGSEVRLAILRCVLPGPKTAAEIVSELKMGTTGQAYHHLRELERAGYVKQKSGKWHFDMRCGRVYLTALALAADAGAEEPDEDEEVDEKAGEQSLLPVPALPVLGAWLAELGKKRFPPRELLSSPFPPCETAAQVVGLFEAGKATGWKAALVNQHEILAIRVASETDPGLIIVITDEGGKTLPVKKATANGKGGAGAALWFVAENYPFAASLKAQRENDRVESAKVRNKAA